MPELPTPSGVGERPVNQLLKHLGDHSLGRGDVHRELSLVVGDTCPESWKLGSELDWQKMRSMGVS